MKKRVLIFPAGSEIGLEINRALAFKKDVEVFGLSSASDFSRLTYENFIPDAPFISDKNFVMHLNKIIDEYKIDFIFPAHDDVVLKLATEQKNVKAEVLTAPLKTCKICRSKKKTYRALKNIVPVPRMYNKPSDSSISYPAFMKPDIGQGSKGAVRVDSRREAELLLEKNPSLILLEYLPGREYTVSCFTDSNGELTFVQPRERLRITNGISVESRSVDSDECRELAMRINNTMQFRGVWFFQVKENTDGKLVLLEVAPRLAGSTALSRMRGINLPLLTIYDRLGIKTQLVKNSYEIEVSRALSDRYKLHMDYGTIFVDFDDAIIVDGRVNDALVAFLYRSSSKGKKICLITKHAKDINKTLKEYKLAANLFDEIIALTREDEKSTYITSHSIFIDDSFSERRKVHEAHGIPVFDVSEAVGLQ